MVLRPMSCECTDTSINDGCMGCNAKALELRAFLQRCTIFYCDELFFQITIANGFEFGGCFPLWPSLFA